MLPRCLPVCTTVYHASSSEADLNAAQGYRLGLLSATHASPAGAAVYEKCQFSASLPMISEPETIPGALWCYPEILNTIVPVVPKL